MARRQAGLVADKMQVRFETFEILYRLKYLGFYHCNVTTVLEIHFSWLLSSKVCYEVCFEVRKIWLPFFHVNPHYRVLTNLTITKHYGMNVQTSQIFVSALKRFSPHNKQA